MALSGLKWSPNSVVDSIIMVWKCVYEIKHNESLMKQITAGPSLEILVQLSLMLIELDISENREEVWSILSK